MDSPSNGLQLCVYNWCWMLTVFQLGTCMTHLSNYHIIISPTPIGVKYTLLDTVPAQITNAQPKYLPTSSDAQQQRLNFLHKGCEKTKMELEWSLAWFPAIVWLCPSEGTHCGKCDGIVPLNTFSTSPAHYAIGNFEPLH